MKIEMYLRRYHDVKIGPSTIYRLLAAILARTLKMHTDVAVTWRRYSAGDWAANAADAPASIFRVCCQVGCSAA
ncbi:hypothetical protein [Actinophytocola xanthii]|uniref:hypothetical protein n=1 Tax=Actinophytocola xanthii TaxID=1912961 RepID=UPI001178A56C|nr:hypothetical protein [Actinophytocola xanthii]